MMKKVIKKLLAALLAVAMLCAMAIPGVLHTTLGRLRRTSTQNTITALSRSSRVMLVMTIRRFPTLVGAKASLIMRIFWRN